MLCPDWPGDGDQADPPSVTIPLHANVNESDRGELITRAKYLSAQRSGPATSTNGESVKSVKDLWGPPELVPLPV